MGGGLIAVAVRAEHDRAVLAGLLGRDPVLHAYQLGDLDDFFWPYTSWFRRDDQVVLLYHGVALPTLLAFAAPDEVAGLAGLLAEAAPVLPARMWAHLSPGLEATLGRWFVVSEAAAHHRMALTDPGRLAEVPAVGEPLGPADAAELSGLYAVAYPGNWFDARMLETGQYVGVRERGRLVAVAGVHVFSPRWRVAALGNVTTHPDVRGRGLGAGVVAALCARLLASVDHVTLNVRADNAAAVRLYERLGFSRVAGFTECALTSAASAG
ncbi:MULTISPECIES: GNAT family N-acetyltransferase [unclassified Micromonospora]|uniref:GNAT family N-acetyltransferase n=1 Tax=unclassified Micromonospora TaxID=2617518 RepID=UPI001B396361|nr:MULTISPECIES: GNAT family N-acetyltransferase [unclassified Micromonospora]MBQ1046463.1 GNAT family N-acetyltransferase [Micromonospora sp. C72]MBQ1058661.1 GNAT family N-acetyltransferase [Micromonospora sp. C32]